jgi:tetratricopeptide (TPR) repeat protein
MRDLWNHGILQKILLVGILIALLGIAPRPYIVTTSFKRVRRAQEASQPLEVADNLAILAERLPWRTDLWESAGDYAMSGGDFQIAAECFTQAAALGQLSSLGYLSWGDVYAQNGNPYTAIQIWEIAGQLGFAEIEILTRKAEVHRSSGDDLALIEDLKALLSYQLSVISDQSTVSDREPALSEVDGSSIAGLQRELGLLLAAYEPASAPPYLLQAAELDPSLESQLGELIFAIQRALPQNDTAYTLIESGRALANQGNWELASTAFGNAVELRPDYAEAWAYLGESHQHLDEGEDAFVPLPTAIQLNPASIAAQTFLALYFQRQGDYESALDHFKEALKLDPRNPALLVDIGNLVAAQGNLDTGEGYYWQAIDLSPGDPTYIRELIEFSIRYNIDLRKTALPAARQAVMLNPNDPASLDVMGQVLFRLDDLIDAERFYLRALENDPLYAPAHLHLGLVYSLNGKTSLSRDHLQRAIDLAPGTPTAAQAQRILDGK